MKTYIRRACSTVLIGMSACMLTACASSESGDSGAVAQKPKVDHTQWSSKAESTVSAMPDRPELDLGPAFAVTMDESDLRATSIEVLQKALDSTNPLLRMSAIAGLKFVPELAPDALRRGVGDENRAVRYVSTMLVGELKLKELQPLIVPLLHDESESVQASAIYAMKRCGGQPQMTPLARMLLSDNTEVKGNAAMVLGDLGDPSATSLLKYALGRGLLMSGTAQRKIVELQISEALVNLGDTQQLEVIRAALFSRPEEGEIVAFACQICGEIKDEGSLPNLMDFATRSGRLQQSAEIRMAAALAVARINPMQAMLSVPEGYVNSSRFELRSQAAYTIGGCKQKAGLPMLARMLQDPNPLVQVSAAAAILEIES